MYSFSCPCLSTVTFIEGEGEMIKSKCFSGISKVRLWFDSILPFCCFGCDTKVNNHAFSFNEEPREREPVLNSSLGKGLVAVFLLKGPLTSRLLWPRALTLLFIVRSSRESFLCSFLPSQPQPGPLRRHEETGRHLTVSHPLEWSGQMAR